MTLIEIIKLSNGGHRYQPIERKTTPPKGWAIFKEDVVGINGFLFGDIETEEINGITTVTKWVPGTIPEHIPEPETELTINDLADAILEGVNEV